MIAHHLSSTKFYKLVPMGVFPTLSSAPTNRINWLNLLACRRWKNRSLLLNQIRPPDPSDPPDFPYPPPPSAPFPSLRSLCAAARPPSKPSTSLCFQIAYSTTTKLSLTGKKICSDMGVNLDSMSRFCPASPPWTICVCQRPKILTHNSKFPKPYFPLNLNYLWAWPKLNYESAGRIRFCVSGPYFVQHKSIQCDGYHCGYAGYGCTSKDFGILDRWLCLKQFPGFLNL